VVTSDERQAGHAVGAAIGSSGCRCPFGVLFHILATFRNPGGTPGGREDRSDLEADSSEVREQFLLNHAVEMIDAVGPTLKLPSRSLPVAAPEHQDARAHPRDRRFQVSARFERGAQLVHRATDVSVGIRAELGGQR
jgi:hypothetical protein